MNRTTHPFEKAGLGIAPFKDVGFYVSKFQAVPGDPGCPVQPGASCDYCGQGIMNVCVIRDTDGKEFKVGCDCVAKTKDRTIADPIARKVALERKASADARNSEKITILSNALADDAFRASLAAEVHPVSFCAAKGGTKLDWVERMFKISGVSGKIRLAKTLGLL